MNESKAQKILQGYITEDGDLHSVAHYMYWRRGHEKITLDCEFTASELEAIAWWMRHSENAEKHTEPREPADTSLNMIAGGMIAALRRVADDMEETGDRLQACEDRIALDGAFSKGSEMKGAADMAREWALRIETVYFPNA